MIDDLKLMSMQAAARKHGLGGSQVSRLMERAVARGLARRERRHPKRIGIDETSFQKRHEYVTLVTDHDPARGRRGTVLHVADDKGSNAIEGFFKGLRPSGCAGVETAAMDFAPAYMRAAFVHTDADICIDHFHVTSLVVKALEQVRRTEHSKLTRQGDDRLKGTRFDWLMTPERMSPQRRKRLDGMLKQDLRVCEAWRLKEWIAEIWALKDRRHAYHAWEAWYQEVMRSGLSPMIRAARTIWKHIEEILNASMLGISNALSESINSKVNGSSGRLAATGIAGISAPPSTFTWEALTSTLAPHSTHFREAPYFIYRMNSVGRAGHLKILPIPTEDRLGKEFARLNAWSRTIHRFCCEVSQKSYK